MALGRVSVITGIATNPDGSLATNVVVTARLLSSLAGTPLLTYYVVADPANGKLIQPTAISALTDGTTAAFSLSLTSPGDIVQTDSTGNHASSTYYVISTVGGIYVTTTAFAYSGSPRDLGAVTAATVAPPYTTAAVTFQVVIPDQTGTGGVVQAWLNTPGSIDGQLIQTSPPFQTIYGSSGAGTLNLPPNDMITPSLTYYHVSFNSGPVYDISVPTLGGDFIDLLTNPLASGSLGAATTTTIGPSSNLTPAVDDPHASPSDLDDQLVNLNAQDGLALRTITTSAAIDAVTDDRVFCNAAGGAIAPPLPAASARSRRYYFHATSAAHATTITAAGSDTMVGGTTSTTAVLSTLGQWFILQSDGVSKWFACTDTSSGTGGAASTVWVLKSANYTALVTDTNILVDATSGAVTITLFTAVGFTGRLSIKKMDSSANAVNIKTVSAQTIDGVNYATSPLAITTQYQSLTCVGDNANFWIE